MTNEDRITVLVWGLAVMVLLCGIACAVQAAGHEIAQVIEAAQ